MKTKDLEKKFRKNLRQKNLLREGIDLVVVDDESVEAEILELLLKRNVKDPTIKIKRGKTAKKKVKAVLIRPTNLEKEIVSELKRIFSGRKGRDKEVVLTEDLTEKEIDYLAKKLKTKRKRKTGKERGKVKEKKIREGIEKLQKEHPETKQSILSSIRKIEGYLEKSPKKRRKSNKE